MKKLNLLLITSLALSLQGCFFVAGAAAGAAAVGIVYDHRNVDSILQDQKIARRALQKIQDDQDLEEDSHISVTSFGQVVLLTGETPNAEQRQKAEELTRSVRGVTRVYNAITIQGPTSALTHASDAWITTKIKTEMLATKGLQSASIKVVTENGTVYLMGTVTHTQENTLINIARHTNGVQKVIKIFQYDDGLNNKSTPKTQIQEAGPSASNAAVVTPQNSDDLQPLISS